MDIDERLRSVSMDIDERLGRLDQDLEKVCAIMFLLYRQGKDRPDSATFPGTLMSRVVNYLSQGATRLAPKDTLVGALEILDREYTGPLEEDPIVAFIRARGGLRNLHMAWLTHLQP